ncbi:helix-turn-helix transcriptional regulator [Pantoea agglomerans]|uniref:helix-turn-helix domain-containing protein n=1 Tax=Enterobacter agglomerans TaxID=549 RepID=UPI00320B2C63
MMTTNISSLELGKHLTLVRERAGIKQAELARKVTWSAAVLSRIESGERSVDSGELSLLLEAIDTPEASRLRTIIERSWQVLERPSLDHPDQDLLWSAEEVAKQLTALAQKPDTKHAFERRLSTYVDELKASACLLLKREHQVAFIGSIGIGKSTAICRLTGLEVAVTETSPFAPVLEAGAGGITVCEVHLRQGPGYGLLIDPTPDDAIRAHVSDFAEYIRGNNSQSIAGEESQGISKEIERAIRNLAGLRISKSKGEEGKVIRSDEAKELAKKYGSTREIVVEILSKMELPRRDRRDVWYDASTGKQPLNWLKDTFEEINNGRHPEFTLPARIEVFVPEQLLPIDELSVRFIDTKGIDRTAARSDLEGLLYDPHTLAILCSGFNNAPAAEARLLLERGKDAGVRDLIQKAALLVLPRSGEALEVKDEVGMKVESVEEGYELKHEQISMSLAPLGLSGLAVGFFDSRQDDPLLFQSFLSDQLDNVRRSFGHQLNEIISNAKVLLQNYEQAQTQEVIRQAALQLRTWINRHRSPEHLNLRVQDSLIEQLGYAYAATIRASVNRDGDWYNLNFGHHLGYGARKIAVQSLHSAVLGFTEICHNMAVTPDLEEAAELLGQSQRLLQTAYDELLAKIQIMGQTSFREELKQDRDFWTSCQREWGLGSGYKGRIVSHSGNWFKNPEKKQLEDELWSLIQREWNLALNRVESLLVTDE